MNQAIFARGKVVDLSIRRNSHSRENHGLRMANVAPCTKPVPKTDSAAGDQLGRLNDLEA